MYNSILVYLLNPEWHQHFLISITPDLEALTDCIEVSLFFRNFAVFKALLNTFQVQLFRALGFSNP